MHGIRALCVLLLLLAAIVSGCGHEPLPAVHGTVAEEMEFNRLITTASDHNRALVRVTGWCRVEFEGNSLFVTREGYEQRKHNQGVWLNLGWPVSADVLALNGQWVVVEGRFFADDTGPYGFAGMILEIQRIEMVDTTRAMPFIETPEEPTVAKPKVIVPTRRPRT